VGDESTRTKVQRVHARVQGNGVGAFPEITSGKWKPSPYRKKEGWIGKERKGGKVWLVVTRDHVW
jgi:hypothetical protein